MMSDKTTAPFGLYFGALAPKLIDQLPDAADILGSRMDPYQKDADAITRLKVRGIMSDNEAHRARTRLVKAIGKALSVRP